MAVAQGLSTGEKYDVFLSFRGPDTRESFADCLFEFLKGEGLRVFMDDEEVRVGEFIGREIQKAIYDSKLFVPIFSSRFASSKWCLKEIAWMADCMEEFPGKKEMLLPIFYDVDASDVKLKTDLYANALLEHEKTSDHETVERWRKALIKVPEAKGWNRRDFKGQGKLISRISQDISHRLKVKHRILPDHFIGIEEQVQHIMDALDFGSRDVRIVVIHGMGGIGKTTLASAVFNKICWQYQGCSFLSNVQESATGNGILNLQNKLMRDILRFSSSNFCDVNDAMNCIQSSLRNKDVLVVLDDVSDMDQIKKLIGMGDWVGLGSRVIITTRNLKSVANVEEIENNVTILRGKTIFIYHMRELGFDNSLQLLCRHAFGQHVPPHGYEQLTREVISFTRGVPLAIEVLGSYLRRRSAGIWKEMLNKLRKIPPARLYEVILMSSYKTLCDEEKEIFLDIAFVFTGHDKTNAFYYWEACGLFPEMSVDTLISYALVKIDRFNKFWMHGLLKDLGREVVRKQSNGNLGMCSRLCNEDAKRLLLKREGTKHVKALKLDTTHAYNFTPAELSGLSGLKFLELCGGNFVGDFEDGCLSELRWLSWRDCALDFRGTNFYLENLVVVKLSKSSITETWSGWEQFKTVRNLKVLELQSLNLATTPDLSSILSLERLTFRECNVLAHIDPSIGNLESLNSLEMMKSGYWQFLVILNQGSEEVVQLPSSMCNLKALSRLVFRRIKLNQLPENIGELKGLKVLEITQCEFLRTLPDSIGDLKSLIDLDLSGDGITELPESIGKLRNLTKLNVSNNRLRRLPATIGYLDRLKVLDASYNKDLLGAIPDEFDKLRSLRSLNLSLTGICGLPSSFVQLSCLESLNLEDCPKLHGLPDLPTCLTDLDISSTSRFPKSKNLTVGLAPILPPYSSTEFVNIDPSINNLECVNSLEMINHPWSPANVSLAKSRFHLPSSICNIKALSRLEIRRIKFNQLPENIGELKGLKVLVIRECEFLRTLPDSIGDLESLINLDLSGDGITELPESIGKLRNLTKLNVSNNQLRRLPATIGDLDRLEVLDASYNRDLQGEIPGEFGKLRSLESLNLSQTEISGLPSSIVQLSRLESLNLGSFPVLHGLPDLPTCLTRLVISSTPCFPKSKDLTVELSPMLPPYSSTEFVHIDPMINNLECVNSLEMINHPWSPADVSPGKSCFHLPSSICNLKALSSLEVRSIKLNQLPENIGELKGLEGLVISECEFLRTLPDSVGDLESLIDLDLSGDGITELPESIGKLRSLTKLNVSNNRLRRLPATIGDLDRLEVLHASDNKDLQGEIPDEFGKLRSLKSLNLSLTGICGLPSTMVQLARLDSLHLESCNEMQEVPELPTRLTKLEISSRSLKAVPNLSSLTNLADLSLLNGGNHDYYGHNHQVPPYLCDRLDQLSRLGNLQLSIPNPSLLSLLPPGLERLSLYHSSSLSCWERLSYLGRLWRLDLHESIASEIRLDGLESLTNLTCLVIRGCDSLERVHDLSRLQKLVVLHLSECPKLVEIGGLAQPPESLLYLEILNCDSIRGLPRLSDTGRPGLKVIER